MSGDNIPAGGDATLVGISLASEAYLQDTSYDLTLGVVSVQDHVITIKDLRQSLPVQLEALPASFSYLTKEGWPISNNQEDRITVKQILNGNNVVRVYRSFDKPRVGIITIHDNRAIGFVFIEYRSSLADLRTAIQEQIGHTRFTSSGAYRFLDRNGWPILHDQESTLSVIDALLNSMIVIEVFLTQNAIDTTSQPLDFTNTMVQKPSKRPRLNLKELTYISSKDQQRQISVEESETFRPKQILISYVRSEAAQHAVDLKVKLVELGCASVFLDVHEIKSGVDWADSLNYAVSNCEVFIPLVTPRYGETQWTNREVKLADMLSKFILPILFMEYWPPKCLAIQFATTQFIPWSSSAVIKIDDSGAGVDAEKSEEIAPWTAEQLSDVATKLLQRIKAHQSGQVTSPQIARKTSLLRSCPSMLPEEYSALSQPREGRSLVVISLHPEQAKFGFKMKKFLEEHDYEVCLSIDLFGQLNAENAKDSLSDEELFSQEDPAESSTKLIESESDICLSQLSQLSMSPEMCSDPKKADLRRQFQKKVDEAGVIIFVLSKAYAMSKTCRMQVFYCEHRKRVIPVKYEDFCMPSWLSVLIGTGVFEDVKSVNYKESLLSRVKRALSNEAQDMDQDEQAINSQVKKLKQQTPRGTCIYISGGTKFYHRKSKEICSAIGKLLAGIDDISVVTGGCPGVGEVLSSSYHGERINMGRGSKLWHILPAKTDKDAGAQTDHRSDKGFVPAKHGQSLFSGNSVREREVIVSRIFDICLLIEGGPGAAHEAEQFSWEGHTVIPVQITGGAASGKFNVPEKVFQVPPCVCAHDWSILSNKSASVTEISQSIINIIHRIKKRLQMDSPTYLSKMPSFNTQQTVMLDDISTNDGSNVFVASDNSPRKRKSTPFQEKPR